jgi:AMMECR1 domain-containing protein
MESSALAKDETCKIAMIASMEDDRVLTVKCDELSTEELDVAASLCGVTQQLKVGDWVQVECSERGLIIISGLRS